MQLHQSFPTDSTLFVRGVPVHLFKLNTAALTVVSQVALLYDICVHIVGGRWEVGGGRWEVGGGRWEVGGGRWEGG